MPRSAHPLVADLVAIVGTGHVLTDPELVRAYEVDWTGRFHGRARAVVRPASVEEVVAVVRACASASVPIVPQGGNTGLVGGGVPTDGEVVLSLTRLKALGAVDELACEVTVQAGATLAALQDHVSGAGFAFGVDLAARDSATIGGMIATNAGGVHVLRYGSMRAQLVGIEAVLADGSIVRRLPGLPKDNTGYHLPSLFAGSEGTLGIITAARVRLVPAWRHRVVALAGVASAGEAVAVAAGLRNRLGSLEALELMCDDGLELVIRHTGATRPIPPRPAYVLAECANQRDPTDELAEALTDVLGTEAAARVVVAADRADRARLWALREGHTEAIGREGVPHKLDVCLPLAALERCVADVRRLVAEADPPARLVIFGHLGDGNLHLNVLGPEPDEERLDDAILRAVIAHGGSISAEHGIGRAKRRWLPLDRSAADLAAMRAIKRALDPAGLLNPGVLIDARE